MPPPSSSTMQTRSDGLAAESTKDGVDVGGRVSFKKTLVLWPPNAVHEPPAASGWPRRALVGPANDVRVRCNVEELAGLVETPLDQRAVPGPRRDVRDRVVISGEEAPVS